MRFLRLIALTFAAAGPVLAGAQSAPSWRIEVGLHAQRSLLQLSVCSRDAHDTVRFIAGSPQARAYRVAAVRSGGGASTQDGDALIARDWRAGECLQATVDLAAAARADGRHSGVREGEFFLLDPARWLWRPEQFDDDASLAFELPSGWSESVPWTPLPGRPHRYRLRDAIDAGPALSAIGRFEEQTIELPGGRLRVSILPPWAKTELRRVRPVAQTLLQAYGALPRADTQILIVPLPGQREAAPWGQVLRGGGSAVHLFVGADAAPTALIDDWTATHEFAHLLHPYLGSRTRWLGEGLASYYQNVLRARTGTLSAEEAWSRIEAGFARARAEARSRGPTLDEVSRRMGAMRAFMRVYWSGAAFWFESDRALRARGGSLDDVLRRHAECCLERDTSIAPQEYMAALDRLAGTDEFVRRYRRYVQLTEFPTDARVDDAFVASAIGRAIMQPIDIPAVPSL